MDDGAERVDGNGVEKHVDLAEVPGRVARGLVIERGVTLGAALQLVEEVDHHLRQWDAVDELHPLFGQVLVLLDLATTALAQLHHRARVLTR